jgi:Tfp pilus assembly protein PilF
MHMKMLIAATALAGLGACATPTLPEVKPLERITGQITPQSADSLARNGYYVEAAIAYQTQLKANPDDAAARYGFADAMRRGGRNGEAKLEYAKLLSNSDYKLRALEGMGQASMASGDRESARDSFNQVVAEDTKAWKSWLGIAQLYDLDRNWAKADEAYALALASTNQPALIYNNQGLSRLARGEASWAVDHFRLALATDPTLVRAATNLEIAEASAGKSIEKISGAERDAKERARKLNNAGYVAMLQNRPDEARAFYQAAMDAHPSFYPQAFQNMQALDAAKGKTVHAPPQ